MNHQSLSSSREHIPQAEHAADPAAELCSFRQRPQESGAADSTYPDTAANHTADLAPDPAADLASDHAAAPMSDTASDTLSAQDPSSAQASSPASSSQDLSSRDSFPQGSSPQDTSPGASFSASGTSGSACSAHACETAAEPSSKASAKAAAEASLAASCDTLCDTAPGTSPDTSPALAPEPLSDRSVDPARAATDSGLQIALEESTCLVGQKSRKELEQILHRLLATGENEIIEFKEGGKHFKLCDIARYFSALSNEANLLGAQCAWLVFGVRDKGRQIVGTSYGKAKGALNALRLQIRQATGSVTFSAIHTLTVEDRRVLLFEIPPAPRGLPVFVSGLAYERNGDSMQPLSMSRLDAIRCQAPLEDWTAQPLPSASVADLDEEALNMGKRLFMTTLAPGLERELAAHWSTLSFLEHLRLVRSGRLTRAALLLFGRPSAWGQLSPHPAQIVVRIGSDSDAGPVCRLFGLPMLTALTKVLDLLAPEQSKDESGDESGDEAGTARTSAAPDSRNRPARPDSSDRPQTPQTPYTVDRAALSEALINALLHQDYTACGRIVVEQDGEGTSLISAGSFVRGRPADYLEGSTTPLITRNDCLVQAMMRLSISRGLGLGLARLWRRQVRLGLLPPEYHCEPDCVRLVLPSARLDSVCTLPGHTPEALQALSMTEQAFLVQACQGRPIPEQVRELLTLKGLLPPDSSDQSEQDQNGAPRKGATQKGPAQKGIVQKGSARNETIPKDAAGPGRIDVHTGTVPAEQEEQADRDEPVSQPAAGDGPAACAVPADATGHADTADTTLAAPVTDAAPGPEAVPAEEQAKAGMPAPAAMAEVPDAPEAPEAGAGVRPQPGAGDPETGPSGKQADKQAAGQQTADEQASAEQAGPRAGTRNRGWSWDRSSGDTDPAACCAHVVELLAHRRSATRQDILEALEPLLPPTLSDKDRFQKVSYVLTRLRKLGLIRNAGLRSRPCWVLSGRNTELAIGSRRKKSSGTSSDKGGQEQAGRQPNCQPNCQADGQSKAQPDVQTAQTDVRGAGQLPEGLKAED